MAATPSGQARNSQVLLHRALELGHFGQLHLRSYQTADPKNSAATGYSFASFLLGTVCNSSVPVQYVKTTDTGHLEPGFLRHRRLESHPGV